MKPTVAVRIMLPQPEGVVVNTIVPMKGGVEVTTTVTVPEPPKLSVMGPVSVAELPSAATLRPVTVPVRTYPGGVSRPLRLNVPETDPSCFAAAKWKRIGKLPFKQLPMSMPSPAPQALCGGPDASTDIDEEAKARSPTHSTLRASRDELIWVGLVVG